MIYFPLCHLFICYRFPAVTWVASDKLQMDLKGVLLTELTGVLPTVLQNEMRPMREGIERLENKVQSLDEYLENKVQSLDEHLENKVQNLDEHLENKVQSLENKVQRLENKVQSFENSLSQ